MADVQPFKGLPKVDGQHPDIFPGSPMALVGVFVEIVRARFRDDNAKGLPWVWHEDPTPEPDENNQPDTETDGVPRTIYIESQYTENNDARNFRPAIFVEKEETQTLKLWIGNRGAIDVPSRTQVYTTHVLVPISILCVSNSRGESGNLGDIVFAHILACREEIRATFGLHDLQPPVLGKTTVYRRSSNENETWSTPVGFQVQFKFLWRTRPVAPLLQEVRNRILLKGAGNFEAGAIETATVRNTRR